MSRISQRIVFHGFSEVYQVEALDTVFLPFQESADLRQQGSFRISADIGRMSLQQRRLTEEPRLAAAGTADHQHIFVPGGLGVFGPVVHGEAFRLGQEDVVVKHRVDVRGYIFRPAP